MGIDLVRCHISSCYEPVKDARLRFLIRAVRHGVRGEIGTYLLKHIGQASQCVRGHVREHRGVDIRRECLHVAQLLTACFGQFHPLLTAISRRLSPLDERPPYKAVHHPAGRGWAKVGAFGQLRNTLWSIAIKAIKGTQLAERHLSPMQGASHMWENLRIRQSMQKVARPAKLQEFVAEIFACCFDMCLQAMYALMHIISFL